VPEDNFRVRWTREVWLEDGCHRFYAETDDGVRLFVDGRLVLHEWREMSATLHTVDLSIQAGWHTIQMEYYEALGKAVAKLGWELLTVGEFTNKGACGSGSPPEPRNDPPEPPDNLNPVPPPADRGSNERGQIELPPFDGGTNDPYQGGWFGEYFANRTLSNQPTFTRQDTDIAFHWGMDSPHPRLAADNFSIRWTADLSFQGGRYRFTSETNDGARVYVDGNLIIDAWKTGGRATSREVTLHAGVHRVCMEYFEASGEARARLYWEGPLSANLKGNLVTHVPPYPSRSWVKVYRLVGPETWVDTVPHGYASINADGSLKIDGLVVGASFRSAGHPYWVEQWVDGQLIHSTGNVYRGEPPFRIYPGVDNHTPW
jgi:hypothetical protein